MTQQSTSKFYQAKVSPTLGRERIELIDILRGFAIFGILVANMAAYSGQSFDFKSLSHLSDQSIFLLIRFLVTAKFYSLFSFLFGWGMAFQMTRARLKRDTFLPRYLRRLLILLFFGLIHGVFIWYGDILTLYAILGLMLLFFRRRSTKFLLIATVCILAISILFVLPIDVMESFRQWYTDVTSLFRLHGYSDSLYETGSYIEITRRRLQDYINQTTFSIYSIGNVFAMFLLGLAFGKSDIFQNLEKCVPLFRKIILPVLVIGILLNGVFVSTFIWSDRYPDDLLRTVRVSARTIGAPAMMLFYISSFVLLFQNQRWRGRMIELAPVGKMALSNYLFQSILCTLLFYNYGLGFYRHINPTIALFLTVLLFLIQIKLSRWWMDRYQFGPLEWLWRTITYCRIQPFRVKFTLKNEIKQNTYLGTNRYSNLFLISIWLVLILWGVALGYWSLKLTNNQIDPSTLYSKFHRPEVTNTGEGNFIEMSPEPVAVATPNAHPVLYNPGPIASSGNLVAFASSFNVDQAITQIKELSSPLYFGRLAGSFGGLTASNYIAEQFTSLGLQPAGDGGDFFQSFHVPFASLGAVPRLEVILSGDSSPRRFFLHQDFNVLSGNYAGEGVVEGAVVWASDCKKEDFDNIIVVDKIVVCRRSREIQADRNAIEHGARGLLLLVDPNQTAMDFAFPRRPPLVPEPLPTFLITPRVAEALLFKSKMTVQDLLMTFSSIPIEARIRLEVEISDLEDCAISGCLGRNVLGVLPGRDPAYNDQVVILGAHYDHMGQDPDGTYWPGANDNASGIAVLLEIARAWQAEGYVPRRTVLFAAWDGEELGLLGSRYYVENPSYPLSHTMAMLNLDMVGAGGEILRIDGHSRIADQVKAAAEIFEVETIMTELGRSDHVPFLEAGVPANLIIWTDPEEKYDDYHRPVDTIERIDPERLKLSGEIANLVLLSIVEGEPAINDLVEQRKEALLQGDQTAFLRTSHPDQVKWDQLWFEDALRLNPVQFNLHLEDLLFQGNQARAAIELLLGYSPSTDPSEIETMSGTYNVLFQHTADGWRWTGTDLTQVYPLKESNNTDIPTWATGINFYFPNTEMVDLDEQILRTLTHLLDASQSLGLSIPDELRVEFHRNESDLALSSLPSLGTRESVWIGPGVIKLVLSDVILDPRPLEDALIQSLIFESGVRPEFVPWLWEGIPIALRAEQEPENIQQQLFPSLYQALFNGSKLDHQTAGWAAVKFLRSQMGWREIGQVIHSIGQSCINPGCKSQEDIDKLVSAHFDLGTEGFDSAWKGYWSIRLGEVNDSLDSILMARNRALKEGDEAGFLATVDPNVHHLLAEQHAYYLRSRQAESIEFRFNALPLTMFENGDVIAQVTSELVRPDGANALGLKKSRYLVRLTSSDSGYLWAGSPMHTMTGDKVRIMFPTDLQKSAGAILDTADRIYSQVSSVLNLQSSSYLTIKLYSDEINYRNSIDPNIEEVVFPNIWTGSDQSLKLYTPTVDTIKDLQSELTQGVIRSYLLQAGIQEEWLLRGVSLYLGKEMDGNTRTFQSTRYIRRLPSAIKKGKLQFLTELPDDEYLDEEGRKLADAQTWDAVNFLVETYGFDSLVSILQSVSTGGDFAEVFNQVIGIDQSLFAEAWLESLSQAHTRTSWLALVESFDPVRAFSHVEKLSDESFSGRLAGSEGANAAAWYIAKEFERFGLIPIVTSVPLENELSLDMDDSGQTIKDSSHFTDIQQNMLSYFQYFSINRIMLQRAPSLKLLSQGDDEVMDFRYREDFRIVPQSFTYSGPVVGELVWVPEETYGNLDLDGKIVLRTSKADLKFEVDQALSSRAVGLILVTENQGRYAFFSKDALPVLETETQEIPVLQLSGEAFELLSTKLSINQVDPASSNTVQSLGVSALVDLPMTSPESILDKNVLALLPGSDPLLSKEVVIVGAHYDHVGDDPDTWNCQGRVYPSEDAKEKGLCKIEPGLRYPGANDNASGIGVLLEIARAWQETGYRPARSVLFAAWGAQEAGEVGSRYYVENPLIPLDQTIAMVQIDAVGGGGGFYNEAFGLFDQDGLPVSRLAMIDKLTDAHVNIVQQSTRETFGVSQGPLEWLTWPTDGQGDRSDHIPFRQNQVPSILLRWRDASEENWPQEFAEAVLPERLATSGRLISLLVMSMAR